MKKYESTLELLREHRSIRSWAKKPVSKKIIEKILKVGMRAASAGNMQWYSIGVVRDRKKIDAIYDMNDQPWIKTAPVVLVFNIDTHRIRRWMEVSNAPFHYDGFSTFYIGMLDAAIAAQNVVVAAEAVGLGTVYIGTLGSGEDKIAEILKYPKQVLPVFLVCVGWPGAVPPLRDRLPYTGMVFEDKYPKFSDKDIKKIYAKLDGSKHFKQALLEPQYKKLVGRKTVENPAQYIAKCHYTKDDLREGGELARKTVRRCGFDLKK